MQMAQVPSQRNVGNVCQASRDLRKKRRNYLIAKIEELQNNNKIQIVWDLYRENNDFRKGYQPRTNIVMDKRGDLSTESHRILLGEEQFLSDIKCTWG